MASRPPLHTDPLHNSTKESIPCNCTNGRKISNKQLHMLRMHTPGKVPFQCSCCAETFVTKYEADVHRKGHRNDKLEYECPSCDYKSKNLTGMKQHTSVHSQMRPFHCKVCNMTFKRKPALECHIASRHAPLKSFKCSYCEKFFSVESHLKIHLRGHTGQGLEECEHCRKKFKTSNQPKQHLITHTKWSDFMCSLCEKPCVSRYALELHTRGTHQGEAVSLRPLPTVIRKKGFTKITWGLSQWKTKLSMRRM